MNAGAIALRAWRGDRATASVATRLGIGAPLYERIEAGEVMPEPWLCSAIEARTEDSVPASSWGVSLPDAVFLVLGQREWDFPSALGEVGLFGFRRADGWWLRIETMEAGMSMPMATARALHAKLEAMFGMVDDPAVRAAQGEREATTG